MPRHVQLHGHLAQKIISIIRGLRGSRVVDVSYRERDRGVRVPRTSGGRSRSDLKFWITFVLARNRGYRDG